jgi:hypothetical protein
LNPLFVSLNLNNFQLINVLQTSELFFYFILNDIKINSLPIHINVHFFIKVILDVLYDQSDSNFGAKQIFFCVQYLFF